MVWISGYCDMDRRPGYDYCADTGLTVCYDCISHPGIIGGIDHRLPGTTVICAHQNAAHPWFLRGPEESVRFRNDGEDDQGILHWPAGRCWCDEFHRDQAVTLEFDARRRGLSTFAPRPELLG